MAPNSIKENIVQVTHVTEKGCELRVFADEYFRANGLHVAFKDYFLSFDEFPHFLGATKEEIQQARLSYDDIHWDSLDILLSLDNIEGKKEPNHQLIFTSEQLARLKKYNDEQIAKGGKPWLSDRLLDFEYWNEINK